MCQPRKWWKGIAPLIFLWLLTIWFNTPALERDLTKHAEENLVGVRLFQPKLDFQGRDAIVLGQGFSEQDQFAAIAAVGEVNGVRLVRDATSLIEESRPYGFAARREGDRLVVMGALPDPSTKEQLTARLRDIFPSVKLDDQTRWARGAPERFLPFALFGLAQLAKLDTGELQLNGTELRLSGAAREGTAYNQVREALKRAPEGLSVGQVEIAPPLADPFVFRATRDRDRVTLTGNVPNGSERGALLEAARMSLPEVSLVDAMEEARGAGPAFSTLAPAAINMLGKMTQGTVSLVGDNVTVDGDAATSKDYSALIGALDTLRGASQALEATLRPPRASSYRFEAVRTGGGLRLEGYVPSSSARAALLAGASELEPDLAIDDQLLFAAGEPDGFVAACQWGLDRLNGLTEGRLSIDGTGISLSGAAANIEIRQTIEAAMAAVPPGFFLLNVNLSAPEPALATSVLPTGPVSVSPVPGPVEPPASPSSSVASPSPAAPVSPSVSRDVPVAALVPAPLVTTNPIAAPPLADVQLRRGDGKLTLTGVYSDERAHEEIIDRAQRAFFAEAILDRMTRSDKASRPLAQATIGALSALARLEEGSVTIKDMAVKLEGEALYDRAVEQIKTDLKNSLPASFHLDSAIAVKAPVPLASPAACQKLFSALIARGKIVFDSARASLSRDSTGLMDFLVHAAMRCPQFAIEVDGHTDSDGNPDSNLDLSKRRAQSVVDYLAKAGLDASKLTAVGYGNSRPIADNSTEEGKAENRRIEFVVR
jgi:OOP family OmpA-OmpF porin